MAWIQSIDIFNNYLYRQLCIILIGFRMKYDIIYPFYYLSTLYTTIGYLFEWEIRNGSKLTLFKKFSLIERDGLLFITIDKYIFYYLLIPSISWSLRRLSPRMECLFCLHVKILSLDLGLLMTLRLSKWTGARSPGRGQVSCGCRNGQFYDIFYAFFCILSGVNDLINCFKLAGDHICW